MKRRFGVALVCLFGACIMRENVGSFDEPCPDPTQASTSEEREVCILELAEELGGTRWMGTARSGAIEAEVEFEFGEDGRYRVTNAGSDSSAFSTMFPARDETSVGAYWITDLVNGEFSGTTEQILAVPFQDPVMVPGQLERLVLHGNHLEFNLRFQGLSLYPTLTRLVLTPLR
jgi:hypothetical protein